MTWDRATWLDFNFCISQLAESKSTYLRVTKKIKISSGVADWSSAWAPADAIQGGLYSNIFGKWRLRIEFSLERKDK